MISSGMLKNYLVVEIGKVLDKVLFVGDSTYAIPDIDWLLKDYYKKYKEFMVSNNLYAWKENFDCNRFAAIYMCYLQALHSYETQNEAQSITVGEMWYMSKTEGGPHAINIAMVNDNKIIYIEPQNGRRLYLSKKEKSSAWFIRF